MHEQRIINKVIQLGKLAGAKRKVRIEVGELCDISPEHLKEHLKGQIVEWEIETIYRKAKVKCSCGYSGTPRIIERGHDFVLFNCPSCGEKPIVVEGGEIKIVGVE
ncbi:MAG: hydrogenase/urease maturation nickel metallochaperone HypA [Candidatus Diapherotrites archaeon]